jgi:hypothetical protein
LYIIVNNGKERKSMAQRGATRPKVEGKNPCGRPRIFSSPEELQIKIDKYFEEAESKGKPLTMSGLAIALGIERATLCNYNKDEEYFETIKKARAKVESSFEELLLSGKATAGIIFALKNNFGWADKNELEVSGNKDKPLEVIITVEK